MEEYKQKFAIPEADVKLAPFEYPEGFSRDMMIKIESDRIKR